MWCAGRLAAFLEKRKLGCRQLTDCTGYKLFLTKSSLIGKQGLSRDQNQSYIVERVLDVKLPENQIRRLIWIEDA